MLDIGWTELLLIGIVALIVVGPKDLPMMFRTLGRFTGQARRMAREFTRAMDEAADDAGVKDVQRDLRNIANPKAMGMDALKDATGDMENWSDGILNDTLDKKPKPSDGAGPETQKLAKERAEATAKRKEDASAKTAAKTAEKTAVADPEDPAA